jgi:hypothetical protein
LTFIRNRRSRATTYWALEKGPPVKIFVPATTVLVVIRRRWPRRRRLGKTAASARYRRVRNRTATIAWDDAAAARMKKISAFVRGMVVRAVGESCRRSGLDRVTVEELERIRSRMPTPKFFGS